MPNHVHVLCRPLSGELAAIIRRWKSYTATRINALLGRAGPMWQREYFDRLVRDESELYRAADYILANPQRAGLQGWKWTYVDPELYAESRAMR
jgi:REP element-mobilizing transposase RayT